MHAWRSEEFIGNAIFNCKPKETDEGRGDVIPVLGVGQNPGS